MLDDKLQRVRKAQRETHEWKSATMADSPAGIGMCSWPAPLITVRGTARDTGCVSSGVKYGAHR